MNRLLITTSAVRALGSWAQWAERHCCEVADSPGMCCYGPGYLTWGVQSNWNYVAAMATLSVQPNVSDAALWRARALAALRFALVTHVTGNRYCPDGKKWGHSWISMLGIERAMHGIFCLKNALTPEDQSALRRVLTSEANWLLHEAQRGKQIGVVAGKWNSSGRNAPESNIWSGCLLWRVARMYPDEVWAPAWADLAHDYLINGVSIDADAESDTPLAGKPIRARHVGANFFPHFALDHHGYLNVGYMAICVSNAAMLHFDMRRSGFELPASLDHHQADLWKTLRRMIFSDGRLARIGGDTRVRYAYCQDYLLPALLYAADRFQDPYALGLAERQVAWIMREAETNMDGSFYGARLAHLRDTNPHYYTRLESDRAVVLAMLLNYLPLVSVPPSPRTAFDESAAGDWLEEGHGAALSRCPSRLASFSWRAFGLGQALCLPPGDSSLAEWSRNLCPVVRFLGDDESGRSPHRRLIQQRLQPIVGGFVTCGSIMEGVDVAIDEGASCTDQAVTRLAFAALPDGHTCVALQYVVCATDRIGVLVELKGLHLNIPNDIFNESRRVIRSASGKQDLMAPAKQNEIVRVAGKWINIDESLGVVMLYGSDTLCIDRAAERRGGKYKSLHVEEVCSGVYRGLMRTRPGEVLVDIGCAVLSNVDAAGTSAFAVRRLNLAAPFLRGVCVNGFDGKTYAVIANFGADDAETEVFGTLMGVPAGTAIMETAEK